MGRKRRTMEGLDEDELELVKTKLYPAAERSAKNIADVKASFKVRLKCRNRRQKELHNAIMEKEITFCQGSAGTGKSYVAAETALELFRNGPYTRIIICCPNVESSAMPLGLLPGTVDEKMQPYMDAIEFTLRKVLDESGNVNSREVMENLLKSGYITEEPAAFLRGKTFDDAIIVVDESENFNRQEMLLILTRIGRNSKMVFLGDNQQIDRKDIRKAGEKCGLDYAFETLQGMDEVGFVEFTEEDIVRNPVIGKVLKRWNGLPG